MTDNNEALNRAPAAQALMRAAADLFTEKGYEAVGTRELADAAGVNLAAIQYHFGSKEKLFVETVKFLMERSGCDKVASALGGEVDSQEEAARKLCRYVHAVLQEMVNPQGPKPCRLMFREILTQSPKNSAMYEALVSSVVDDFVQPLDDLLIKIVKKLAPKKSREELEFCAQSISGQIAFYLTHRPFYERLRGKQLADPVTLAGAACHVAKFSLGGLGVDEKTIKKVLRQVFPEKFRNIGKAA